MDAKSTNPRRNPLASALQLVHGSTPKSAVGSDSLRRLTPFHANSAEHRSFFGRLGGIWDGLPYVPLLSSTESAEPVLQQLPCPQEPIRIIRQGVSASRYRKIPCCTRLGTWLGEPQKKGKGCYADFSEHSRSTSSGPCKTEMRCCAARQGGTHTHNHTFTTRGTRAEIGCRGYQAATPKSC